MSKRFIQSLVLCSLAGLIFVATRSQADPPPADKKVAAAAPAKENKEATPAPANQGIKAAASKVTSVTVYPNSALITREVEVPNGPGLVELTVTPLPPTTVNSSLYTEGSEGIRVLTTRFRTRAIQEDTRADVRKLQDELKSLQLERERVEAEILAAQSNQLTITKMESFLGVTTVQATEKGVLNSESAIAMAKHIRETRLELAREVVTLKQKVQANQELTEFAQRRLSELSTGTARTERDAVIVVEKTNAASGKVKLNYLVDAVTWRPQYKLRAGKTNKEPVQIEYLAAVVQHTGEDWSNVHLVLSTAEPTLNAAPPALQTLEVSVVPRSTGVVASGHGRRGQDFMEIEQQSRDLRSKAQKDFNDKKPSSGVGLVNTAAAQEQSWELFNPDAAVKRGCLLATVEGATVTYHLKTRFSVPSRNDEQILEVTRLEFAPDYYYKAVPILTTHVYRQAELSNKSEYILLPGEATMYIGNDFVGRMDLPLVAVGEQFTAGFGVDPQLQVKRQMVDRNRSTHGGNQALRYDYRILVSSYKSEKVKMQVWDRLPHAETETLNVNLVKAAPEISKDALYLREERTNNLLRWDIDVDPQMTGEKALAINYQFTLELDRQMTISSFQPGGSAGPAPQPAVPVITPNQPPPARQAPAAMMPGMSPNEVARIKREMDKLAPDDRRLAEAQFFCAIDQDSPLGSTGPIFKEIVKGQPIFLCCKGCVSEVKSHPDEALVQLQKLRERMAKK